MIYYYENGVYKIVKDRDLTSCIIKYINPAATAAICNNVIFYIKNRLHNDNVQEIDTNLVNFKNTFFDLKTMSIISHSREKFTINQLNVNYQTDLKHNVKVEQYLDEITSYNILRKIGFLQIVGYLLTSKNDIQKMIIFYGPSSSNGKSTFLKILEKIIGSENICHKSIEKLDNQFEAEGLEFKLLNICTEIPKKEIKNIEILKQAITGDIFETNVKYEKNKTIKSNMKFVFASNYLPNTFDDSEAFFRRLHIVPFENKFQASKSKFDIDEFCTEENLDYLANRAFNEYLKMRKSGVQEFANFEESNSILLEFRKKSNSIIAFLTDEFYKDGIYNQNVSTKSMFEYYTTFCNRTKMKPSKKIEFFKELQEKYSFQKKIIDGKHYFFRKEPISTEEKDLENI